MVGRRLLILGAGQFGKMVKELADEMHMFEKIAFLDDRSEDAIGCLDDYERFLGEFTDAVVAIGNPDVRLSRSEKLRAAGYRIAAIVSPAAYVSPSAVLGDGCVIEPNATVQTGAHLGEACIVASGAVVRHNARMESGACLDCNAVLMSDAVLREKTKIPALTVLRGE